MLFPAGLPAPVTISTALLCLDRSLRAFATDPVGNTLAETALALPVKYQSLRKSGQMSLLLDESAIVTPKQHKLDRASVIPQLAMMVLNPTTDASQLLQTAFNLLRSVGQRSQASVSMAVVSQMHKALSQMTLMSSALAFPVKYSPLAVVLQSLVPKDESRCRERCAIQAETQSISDTESHENEKADPKRTETGSNIFEQEFKDLIGELPQSWIIASVGLSQDHTELLLSRIEACGSPFLMRVPLGRPDADDTEVREFTFHDAKAELVEIVRLAAESSHDERGAGDKQARKEWFAEREKLDCRLKLLLTNIENVWLGGFRGLLDCDDIDRSLLSRFGQSLSLSLDAHLPSRQKAGKTFERVNLHAHVLELFVRLPFKEGSPELDDSITDLLYFVIDILQFNGEPNAYDEIDFDALLVGVLEALRSYHAVAPSASNKHTILILDKELEAFPWESLPILHHRSVSRMPSLGAIKDRLDRIRTQSATADSLSIPTDNGAYILNPSGDLVSTQTSLEPLLSSLNYHPLVNEPPTELQFQDLLTSHSLLLYFGHGSGAQYIRKRLIRRLSNVAVTWLMGCSSVKMTEVGQFESYGICSAYVFGGAPAVVGTLWDVTDRDLDRGSVKGLSLWGLVDELEEESSKVKGKGKGKEVKKRSQKKERPVDDEQDPETQGRNGFAIPVFERYKSLPRSERKGRVTIGEAVSAARQACRLRYLNGAAIVVYGVPVVLGD
jgi:separase